MRPSISGLRDWSPQQLRASAAALIEADRRIEDLRSGAARAIETAHEFWQGQASTTAAAHWSRTSHFCARVSSVTRTVADLYAGAANTVGEARNQILDLIDEATLVHGLTVTDSGNVVPPPAVSPWTVADVVRESQAAETARDFRQRISDALDALDDADTRAATAVRHAFAQVETLMERPEALSHSVVDILEGRSLLPDNPADLNRFWTSLSPNEKDALATWDPSIGSRDGLPAVDRDHYNRHYLSMLESSPDRTTAAGYGAVRGDLSADTFLLSVGGGHAVIAVGNPDAADNVATLIPGTGSGLSGLAGDLQRTRAMYDAASGAAPTEATSVILWSGYDAPPTVPDAGADRYAHSAVSVLDSFQDGLRASHDGQPSHNVVIGHSYGSTVIGAATTEGASLGVDELVFVASPGVDVERVSELSLDGVDPADMSHRVHATTAFWDPVQLVPRVLGVHGFDPSDPEFGAQVFASAAGAPGVAVHSDYWDAGNPALTELGRIIVGP